ncbi:MAG: hypothetical protein ACLUR5_07600 [Eubacterium ventriosum]
MNEKESTINELDKALLLDYKVWLLLSKKEYDNAIKKYNKAIRLVENYHNLNEISARSSNLLSNIYNNLSCALMLKDKKEKNATYTLKKPFLFEKRLFILLEIMGKKRYPPADISYGKTVTITKGLLLPLKIYYNLHLI